MTKATGLAPRRSRCSWLTGPPAWWLVAAILVLGVLAFTPFDRGLEFDEAVQWSQSGGLGGPAPANPLAASRENGNLGLIMVLRNLGLGLAGVRLGWAVIALGGVLAAFWLAGRSTGRGVGPVAALIYGTFWITGLFYGSFYGSLLGGLSAVLATGAYLWLRDEADRPLLAGALLGLALSGMFAMRHLESALVVVVFGLHALTVDPRRWLSGRWRGLLSAGVVFGLTFVLPWSLWTIDRYGSVLARMRFARAQGHPLALHNGLVEWAPLLLGDSVAYDPLTPLPVWPRLVLALGWLLLTAGIVWLLIRRVQASAEAAPRPERHVGLLFALLAVTMGFFFFVSGTERARYSLYALGFAALLAGQAVVALRARMAGRGPGARRAALVAAVLLTIGWLGTQAVIVHAYQLSRELNGQRAASTGVVMRSLAGSEPCFGITPFGRTIFQTMSGCRVVDYVEGDRATAAEQLAQGDRPVFLIDTDPQPLGPDWLLIQRPGTGGAVVYLYAHLPNR